MILRKSIPIPNEAEYLATLELSNQNFKDNLISNVGILPVETPIEIHPYLNEFQLQNFNKYIIGTYPPISYVRDLCLIPPGTGNIPSRPIIPFYHGNVRAMWKLFGINNIDIIFNLNRIQAKQELINFLNNRNINYCDIIYSVKRKKYTSFDTDLKNIVINKNLLRHVLLNNNVNRLLFITGSPFSQAGLKIHISNVQNGIIGRINVNSFANSFDLFFRACQDLGFKIEFKVENSNATIMMDWTEVNIQNNLILNTNLKTKIIFKSRITIPKNNYFLDNRDKIIKELLIITPFSPAAQGSTENNPIVSAWRLNNNMRSRHILLSSIYNAFINFTNDDKELLYNLNTNI